PSVMNPSSDHDDSTPQEQVCRICRSEGTPQEPLYHPCKCSGSIKFVHQDCLMEWLQHSQKKYCELCKTPFTFTKIYDPDMPKTLPTPLFLRQSIRRLGRDLLFYARAVLVGIVWLCCLPWMVRSMWLSWFWISDGGWWRDPPGPTNGLNPSPTSELSAEATSSANGRGIVGYLSSPSLSAVMSPVNGAAIVNTTIESVNNATNPDMVVRDGIFFSHNPFYQATRFPAINRTMLHILDGQILTAFIVFSFIVVFLIREWVVQQQPAILGDAANIPLLNEQPFPPAAPALEPVNDGDEEDDAPRPANVALPNELADEAGNAEFPRERVIARPRRRRPVVIDAEDENNAAQDTMDGAIDQPAPQQETVNRGTSTAFNFAEALPRPTPTRETTSHVANLRREVEESGRSAGPNSMYDFSGSGSSTENIFQFGSNPPPSRPPATEALFASRPWRDNAPWDQELPDDEYSASRLDTIDTGRTTDWMEANTSSQSGSNTTERPMSFTGLGYDPSRLSFIADGQDDNTVDDDHSTESSNGSYQMIGKPHDKGKQKDTSIAEESSSGSSGKGKGKEVTHDTEETLFNFDDLNDAGEQANDSDDDSTTEGSRGYRRLTTAKSDWSAAATAGDTPDPSSSSGTPPPPPRRADSLNYYERRPIMHEPPPPRVNENEQQQRIQEIRNRLLRGEIQGDIPNILRDIREENRIRPNEEMVRPIIGAVPERNDAAGQRRGGFLDWIMEDQQPPIDMDDDTDDEEPPIAPPVLVNDDAADDFEGIMELVGMRGPLMGLVQNAAISSLLITATVAVGVAFPYVTGKTVMVILAHPIVFFVRFPLKIVSFSAEFLVDFSTMVIFHTLLFSGHVLGLLATPFSWILPDMSAFSWTAMLTNFLRSWANDGQSRVLRKWVSFETSYVAMKKYTPASTPPLRLVVKEALNRLSGSIMWGLEKVGLDSLANARITAGPAELDLKVLTVTNPVAWTVNALEETFAAVNFTKTASPTIDRATLDLVRRLDPSVTYKWNFWDRLGVVFLGYAAFTVIGMVYVTRRRHDQQSSVERVVIEFLKQCGGVMKVVLIIGIEMFLFPLYCGLLLDVAMLPVFETATLASRIQFAIDFPFTNVFVHWFVGTCYMFHFALFVSMCRKIMRTGVLHFIRDPDDPTFHPVRDVLNRPVLTQLRKIGFSAFIYGILVLVCLGGVVWGLYGATQAILPIHWASNEPVFEFPVDLLFYNFLMPVGVKFFKPADALHVIYGWWFRRCARALRLTSFMFGERHADEEGYTYHPTWRSWFLREKGDAEHPVMPGEFGPKDKVHFVRDGRFVRAPASDSIRRAKGVPVFIPVDENNVRTDIDPALDVGPTGRNNNEWRHAYIPPYFKARIGAVVVGIWLFAALTGVSVTIAPLLLGRHLLRQLVPNHVRLNDIYAFAIGVYILGGLALLVTKLRAAYQSLTTTAPIQPNHGPLDHVVSVIKAAFWFVIRTVKITYILAAFAIVIPTLVALIIELYFIIPLHTAFGSSAASFTATLTNSVATSTSSAAASIATDAATAALSDTAATAAAAAANNVNSHTIHFIQDWTLGVLYVKMMGKMMLLDDNSHAARMLRAIVADGWLNPDVVLATKVFVFPYIGAMLCALLFPLALGRVFLFLIPGGSEGTVVYRYSYPAVLLLVLMAVAGWQIWKSAQKWKESIKDDVYLRGMMIHNHHE
ncbi:hypothetical protein BZA77DRAFT_367849, partial [Pyronema omphalodes]